MIFEKTVFFPLIISLITTSAALLMLAVSHLKMLKKHNFLLKEKEHLKLQQHKKEVEILEEARQKAVKIIADAHFAHDNAQNEFQEQLKTLSLNKIKDFEKASIDLFRVYKQELEDLKLNTVKIVNNITKDIENNTIQELKDFKEIIKKETYASQKIVEQKIEQQYAETEQEIEAYKEDRIKKVEDEIYNILQNVAKVVLGKAISLQDHEQLVIDALNKAKTEKVYE